MSFIDWDDIDDDAQAGMLMERLQKVPTEQWTEKCQHSGETLLHLACYGPNADAALLLLRYSLVNARDAHGDTPLHNAALYDQPHMLKIMCAAGADLQITNKHGYIPLDWAIGGMTEKKGDYLCARLLIAAGSRLANVHERKRGKIPLALVEFERHVLRCRSAAAALLRVKRVGQLWKWDKFLLREIALAVWATRI